MASWAGSLGHAGRELRAVAPIVAAYFFLGLAALVRVAAAFAWLDDKSGLRVAAHSWFAAFLPFPIVYGPILTTPRLEK